jgi:hypothetical protein
VKARRILLAQFAERRERDGMEPREAKVLNRITNASFDDEAGVAHPARRPHDPPGRTKPIRPPDRPDRFVRNRTRHPTSPTSSVLT